MTREPDNLWTQFTVRRPGTLTRLAAVMQELREAGIAPGSLTAELLPGTRGRALARLYALQDEALERLTRRGWVDEAGLIAAALPHAQRFAEAFRGILVHGIHELVGLHLDLLRALEVGAPVQLFAPVAVGTAATAHAEQFAREFLLASDANPTPFSTGDGANRGAWLASLYDETAKPAPRPGYFAFRHAQGVAAEVRLAVRHALCAVREGCPPAEIILTARSFGPYAAALEETLEREGLPWTGSLTRPLGLHPLTRVFLLALEVVRDDFPRRATVELLRSPQLHWPALTSGSAPPEADLADRASLETGLIGGLVEWSEVLPRWEPRAREATNDEAIRRKTGLRVITEALQALARRLPTAQSLSWSEHAAMLIAALDELFPIPEDDSPAGAAHRAARAALRGILQELRALEVVLDERGAVPFATAFERVDTAVRAVELPATSEDGGGLRVVDAMQLRGMTCRRLFLMGANSDQLPRTPREDPLLPDAARRRLRKALLRPLPLPLDAGAEERLLLTLVVGCASERIDVSWQRADEAGRARMPSLALRELARLARGRPDLSALVAAAEHAPSHPEHSLTALARDPGLLTPDEERLLAIVTSRAPLDALAGEFPELADGLRLLQATESFAAGSGEFDGRVGDAAARAPVLSISAFQQLGHCPLQYFFHHVLDAREIVSEPEPAALGRDEIGTLVHAVMERTYAQFAALGAFDTGHPLPGAEQLNQVLRRAWDASLSEPLRRRARRLPALWTARRDAWLAALERFTQEDLARIREEHRGRPELEVRIEQTIPLPSGRTVTVRGRLDRRFVDTDRQRIGDYKTGQVDALCNPTQMLKGRSLQVPLYALAAGEPPATIEILALDPLLADDAREVREFSVFKSVGLSNGFGETLDVLVDLRERGIFPLRSGEHCRYCAYTLACRRGHPPTEHREELAADGADYRGLGGKSTKKPLLVNLQGDSGDLGDPGDPGENDE